MSDTALALLITVLLLLTIAAWVPLLHAAEALTIRLTERKAPFPAKEEEAVDTRKVA